MVLIKTGLQHEITDMVEWNTDSLESQDLQVCIECARWNTINIYVGNNSLTDEEQWRFLSEFEDLTQNKLLACGDFNDRGTKWGNTMENTWGGALDNARTNLPVMNRKKVARLAASEDGADSDTGLALVQAQALLDVEALAYSRGDHLPCTVRINKIGKRSYKMTRQAFEFELSCEQALRKIRLKAWQKKVENRRLSQPLWWTEQTENIWRTKRGLTQK